MIYKGIILVIVMMLMKRGIVGEEVESLRKKKGKGIQIGNEMGSIVEIMVKEEGKIMIVEMVKSLF